jgi:hypothetical protein
MILLLSLILSLSAQAEGTALKGKKAAELYQAINNTGAGQCGSGCIDVTELDCSWSNSSDSKRIGCNFKDAQGKHQEVDGAKARRLVKAVKAAGEIDTSCGAGTCGFRNSRNIKCSEEKTAAKKYKTDCSVSIHQESCLAADKKADLENLKMRFSVTQEANPGCETMRGAGGCLPARDMVNMQKLEAMEKSGCKAGRKSHDGDKPTMETY